MFGISLAESTVFQDRYLILRKLGEGGMGSIYLAEQTDVTRQVALKLLHPSLIANDEFRKRFIRECANLSKLSNEHIITFYNAAISDEGQPYAAFEYLTGITLRKALQDAGSLSVPRAIRIIRQICVAVDAAHQVGIIHRDLKPENIMLTDKPEADWVKVLDFGLSKESITDERESQRLTLTGDLVGTADYMSPEQCAGRKADARTDYYAIGCIAYECLAGKTLFTADNAMQLIHRHATESATDTVNQLSKGCPPTLLQLMNALLEKNPDKRPQTFAEIMSALAQSEDEIKAGIGSSEKLTVSRTRKNNKIAYLFLLGTIAIIGIVATLGVISNQHKQQSKSVALEESKQLDQQLQTSRAAPRLAELIDEAKLSVKDGNYNAAIAACEKCLEITKNNPALVEWRVKALIILTQSIVTGQLGDAEPYLNETARILRSEAFLKNTSMSDSRKAKRKLDYFLNATIIYSQKRKQARCIAAAEEFKKLYHQTGDDALQAYLSVLLSESLAYRELRNYEKSLEIDKETIKMADRAGGTASNIISGAYGSLIANCILMERPHKDVQNFAKKYAEVFSESFDTNRFKLNAAQQALNTCERLHSAPSYFVDGSAIIKASWEALRSSTDTPSGYRTQALEYYLLLKQAENSKLKKAELTALVRDFIDIVSQPREHDPRRTAFDGSKSSVKKLLEQLALKAGDSSLVKTINLASEHE